MLTKRRIRRPRERFAKRRQSIRAKRARQGVIQTPKRTATNNRSVMFSAAYPARFLPEADGKGFHVRFPDLPEALTGGDDLEDTSLQAADCLAEAIAGRIARGDDIPQPSAAKRGQRLISVPLDLAPKLALYLALREQHIPNTELAARLGVSETVIRRMLNPKHQTKAEKIQAALLALGKRIVVTFEDAA